ncbi:hypothetical protein E3E22_06065 [Thermococcus sp. MV5]|uniref:hypothetical protein n=1 Tax=Thermococcus sp. MV5 TaxID=1638272 RepID=UPI00143A5471|nr:hypothetical protein [Thermococcus sp. MV5]NJE26190.1 hypothetical protein [Thermococcus sp. MV5]
MDSALGKEEQSPAVSFNLAQKLETTIVFVCFNVDFIDLDSPAVYKNVLDGTGAYSRIMDSVLNSAILLDYLGPDGSNLECHQKSGKESNSISNLEVATINTNVVTGMIPEIDPIEWDELWVDEIRINTIPTLFTK